MFDQMGELRSNVVRHICFHQKIHALLGRIVGQDSQSFGTRNHGKFVTSRRYSPWVKTVQPMG